MKKNLVMCTLLSVLACLSSCKSDGTEEEVGYMLPKTRSIELTDSQKELVDKNNDFAFNLVRKVNEERNSSTEKGKSMFVSPMSVTYMLGMLNSGANDECQKKIDEALGMDGATAQQINEFCHSLMTQAPEADKQVTLESANALFANKGLQVDQQYANTLKNYYDAEVSTLDFGNPGALATINGWAEKKTHGMIPNVLDEISASATMYLMNTVYFEALWTKQFDKANTTDDKFISEDGTQHDVQMMHNKVLVDVDANDVFTSVCLPYGSGVNWNMYILLPEEGKTIDDVLDCMNANYWKLRYNSYKPMVLEVSIPKFSVADKMDLQKPLKGMGLDCLFSKGALSRMFGNAENVCLTDMFQKSRIDVSEEGAKMAAVTVATGDLAAPPSGDHQIKNGKFNANRPFVYVVTEESSNAVFFVGTYTGK